MNEWVGSIDEMRLTGEGRSTRRETCPIVTMTTKCPTLTGLNGGPGGEMPATNRPRHGRPSSVTVIGRNVKLKEALRAYLCFW
jgi:hypothetical protein